MVHPTAAPEQTTSTLVVVACPECRAPAEIEWRAILESTDGPVEHCRINCLNRHWFLMPVARLSSASANADPPSD